MRVVSSVVNSDFQAILQGKIKDIKAGKNGILGHNERTIKKEN